MRGAHPALCSRCFAASVMLCQCPLQSDPAPEELGHNGRHCRDSMAQGAPRLQAVYSMPCSGQGRRGTAGLKVSMRDQMEEGACRAHPNEGL